MTVRIYKVQRWGYRFELFAIWSQLFFVAIHSWMGNYLGIALHFGLFIYFDRSRITSKKKRAEDLANLKKMELIIMRDYLRNVETLEQFNTHHSSPFIMGIIAGHLYKTRNRSVDGKWMRKELKKVHKKSYETKEEEMQVKFDNPEDSERFLTLIKKYLKEFKDEDCI